MEVVVVLSVLAALAAVLTPMILGYLEDAKKAQAINDTTVIAGALGSFVKDTGLMPYKNDTSAAKVPGHVSGTDFECLVGPGNDFVAATDTTTGTTWIATLSGKVNCLTGAQRDTLENHLINNAPAGAAGKAYQTTGKNAWKGPYLPRVNEDPWGSRYLVNIMRGDPGAGKAMFVISAGPNGKLETSSDLAAAATLTASGDDIVARVK